MKREIKFRAFDSKNKKMLYGLTLYNTRPIYNRFVNTVSPHDLAITQYTGLKDCTGREIYEGDIVKLKIHDLHQNGEVRFKDGSFYIYTDTLSFYRWMDYNVEVYGNIYENPKLLK